MQNHLLDFCSQIHQLLQNRNAGYQQRVILSCQSYVKNHLKEPITLNAVAASVNMHPGLPEPMLFTKQQVSLFLTISQTTHPKSKAALKNNSSENF